MATTIEFVIARAVASRSAQMTVADVWVWEERTVAQWDAQLAALFLQQEVVSDASAGKDASIGELEVAFEQLHQNTKKGLNIAKARFRHEPPKFRTIQTLTARSNSRAMIMEEALAWEAAWEKLDPDWSPVPGMTFASVKAARQNCYALIEAHARKKAHWRAEVEIFNELIEQLDDLCVAWYGVATHVFLEDTAPGKMIRGTVPTTSSVTPLPDKVVITLAESPENGSASLHYEADHATTFDIFHKAPGSSDYVQIEEDHTEDSFEMERLAAGQHAFKVIGKNSTGSGEESDAAIVNVAEAKTG